MEPDYCFISERGDVLPRWREAFPGARGVSFSQVGEEERKPATAWVRLPPGKTPDSVLDELHRVLNGVPCIVLSDQPNDDEALASFSAAARGYCNSHAAAPVLQQIADVVAQGGLWIGESLMQRLLVAVGRIPRKAAPAAARHADWESCLTDRERQVALAVAAGASNKEVARQLDITERTVKAHVGAILEKLGLRDRLQLALRVSGR